MRWGSAAIKKENISVIVDQVSMDAAMIFKCVCFDSAGAVGLKVEVI
jgi:hypothetical protein